MAENIYHTFKQGEIGKILQFTLADENGLFDLTGWTVTFAASLNGESAFAGQAVTLNDQLTNPGECYHQLNATTAAIDPNVRGEIYLGELKAVQGLNVFYWPVDKDNRRTYFKIEVQAPLS